MVDRNFVTLLKHARIYFSASVASALLTFLSVPILTILLTPGEFGIVSVFTSYILVFSIIFPLNTHSSIGRYWYECKDDFNEFFGTTTILVTVLLLLTGVIFVFFKKEVGAIIGIPFKLVPAIILFVFFRIVYLFFQQIFTAQRKSKLVSIITVTKLYFGFMLGIALILLIGEKNFYGFLGGQLIIDAIFCVPMVRLLSPYYKFSFKKEHLKYTSVYSLPLMPYALSGVFLAHFDRLMINGYLDSERAGLYSLAYNIGMSLSLVIGAFLASWTPEYFRDMDKKNYAKIDSDIDKMFRIIIILCLVLMLFGEDIGKIIADEKYHESLSIIPVVAFGYCFMALWQFWGRNIGYDVSNTYWTSVVAISAGLLNIVLNSIYIPVIGYKAGAYTTVISYLVMALGGLVVCKYIIKIHVTPVMTVLKPILLLVCFYSLAEFLTCFLSVEKILIGCIKLIIFCIFLTLVMYKYKSQCSLFFKKLRLN